MNLALVVQRYGASVVGGSESLTRTVATMLAQSHEVTVLTTTATDHSSWHNVFAPGEERDGGIRVRRFTVARERTAYAAELDRLLTQGVGEGFHRLDRIAKRQFGGRLSAWPSALQEEYVRQLGPDSPTLLAWLEAHAHDYDRVLFFTYLYATTYFGMHRVPADKIDFYPTLHDEPPAYLPAYARLFRHADRILFNTAGEWRVADRLYRFPTHKGVLLGYGSRAPAPGAGAAPAIPYALYAGRIEPAKGAGRLIEYFIRWRNETPEVPVRLVLIGDQLMDIPRHPDIEYLGYRSEAEKAALMRGALVLVHPSPYESLGLVLLEAFHCGTPALVSAESEVLVDHCRAANAGLWFTNYAEFAAALTWLAEHPDDAAVLGAQGCAYVERNWTVPLYRERLAALYPSS